VHAADRILEERAVSEALPAGCRRRFGTLRAAHVGAPPHPRRGWAEATPPAPLQIGSTAERTVTVGERRVRVLTRPDGRLLRQLQLSVPVQAATVLPDLTGLALALRLERREFHPTLGEHGIVNHQLAWIDLDATRTQLLSPYISGVPRHLALAPDGSAVALAPGDGPIQVRRLPGGEILGEVRLSLPLDAVRFTPDGRFLVAAASGNPNPFAELNDRTPWRQERGRWALPELEGEVRNEGYDPADRPPSPDPGARLEALRAEAGVEALPRAGSRILAPSPCGRWLALETHLLDLERGRFHPLPSPERPGATVTALTWSPDGARLERSLAHGVVEVLNPDGRRRETREGRRSMLSRAR